MPVRSGPISPYFRDAAHREFAEAANPRNEVFAVDLEQFAAWLPRTGRAVLSATSMHSAVTKQRCMRALHSTAKGFALLDPQSALATNHSVGDLINVPSSSDAFTFSSICDQL